MEGRERDANAPPDSPLLSSIPMSLEEYMARYSHVRSGEQEPFLSSRRPPPQARTGDLFQGMAASAGTFPVRHWFDGGTDHIQQESPRVLFSDTSVRSGISVPMPDSRERQHARNAVARRASPSPPLTGQLDSGCEDDRQEYLPRGDPRGDSDRENGRERPSTRAAYRGGRLQSSNMTRRDERLGGWHLGGDSADTSIFTRTGRRFGSWNLRGDSTDAQVPFSPMSAASVTNNSHPDLSSPSLSHVALERESSVLPEADGGGSGLGNWPAMRRRGTERLHAEDTVVQRGHPPVFDHSLRNPSSFQRRQAHGQRPPPGRRSLSDFLREIEDIVRAQRAESGGSDPPVAQTPILGVHRGASVSDQSSVPPLTGRSNSSPGVGDHGDSRYALPVERGRPTRREPDSGVEGRDPHLEYPLGVPNAARRSELPTGLGNAHPLPPAEPWNREAGGGYDSGHVRAHQRASTTTSSGPSTIYTADDASVSRQAMVQSTDTDHRGGLSSMAQTSAVSGMGGVGRTTGPRAGNELGIFTSTLPVEQGNQARWRQVFIAPRLEYQREHDAPELRQAPQAWWLQMQQQQQGQAENRQHPLRPFWGDAHVFSTTLAAATAVADGIPAENEAFTNTPGARENASRRSVPDSQQQREQQQQHQQQGHGRLVQIMPAEGSIPPTSAGGNEDGGGESRRNPTLMLSSRYMYWASQRPPPMRLQQDADAQSDTAHSDSLPSDGAPTTTDHLSVGSSPRGFAGNLFGGRIPDEAASEVEKALFSSLSSLGVRRLLLGRRNNALPRGRSHRSTPEWMEKWLDSGARLQHSYCSGYAGDDIRCPELGDVRELLKLVLDWWAERVCAVAAVIPMSREAMTGEEGGTQGQEREERRGRGLGGMGSFAGDPVAAAQAVEATQDLGELAKSLVPLDRVRDLIVLEGGPTAREAILLKILLVVHEGIAWATDRPCFRYYREEVIPTAMELYACLPQDMLESVDFEVGHTLPDSMFVMTGTVRPTWPRWAERQASPPAARLAGGARSSSNGSRDRFRRFSGNGFGNGLSNGGGGGGRCGMRCAGGWEGSLGFVPGPWMVFRVAQADYLEFYAAQAVALDEATGDLGNMLC